MTTIAFEDLPFGGGNDWDYNDWVADINVLATYFGTSSDNDLVQMDFTITPQAHLAGYTHVMHLDADTIACDGTYELYRDSVLVGSGNYISSTGVDVVLVPNTGSAPGNVTLNLYFDAPCAFDFSAFDPYATYHGEDLFFDPYIRVNNTGQEIHQGDPRMLTVPIDWQWPTPDVRQQDELAVLHRDVALRLAAVGRLAEALGYPRLERLPEGDGRQSADVRSVLVDAVADSRG